MANIELNCTGNLRALVFTNMRENDEIGLPEGYAYEDLYQNFFCAECATHHMINFEYFKLIGYCVEQGNCGECGRQILLEGDNE